MGKGAEMRIRKYLKDENYPVKVIIYSMERVLIWGNYSRNRTRDPKYLTIEVKEAIERAEHV